MITTAPYGAWRSPITSELIVSSGVRLGQPFLDGDDCYWLEGRPLEGGRIVLVRRAADGTISDMTPAEFSIRTLVHEYGGGACLVHDGTVYFVNYADQRFYRQRLNETPHPITSEGSLRYADFVLDSARSRLISVCEDHSAGGEAENYLAAIDLATGAVAPLARGRTFYASPRLSPDGAQLAWMAWDHPHMPWDAAELWVGTIEPDGWLGEELMIAGGVGDSVFQPEWGLDGTLYYVAERTGWWNLYRLRGGRIDALYPVEAEFGQPLWQFGMTTYAVLGPDQLVCGFCERGTWRLGLLDATAGALERLDLPYTDLARLQARDGRAILIAGAPTRPKAVVLIDLSTRTAQELRQESAVTIDPGYLTTPETIEFPTEGKLTAFGFFYPPRNKDYAGPPAELPPLLVMSHGGPTGATSAALDLEIQYWTSRGIAVLDVNYGGSTGYGREYRERLDGRWGIVDVDDCTNGARFLAAQGRVDSERLAITGGSAGGYTTLAALTFRDVFKAGASHYGIGDLEAMVRDTHKFESRYLDRLIGPYPQRRDLYHERSPIHHIGLLECPVIFFQGLEDKVVPPNQAESMVAALRTKGIPVAYLPFEGEQHGFRKAENIKRALDAEFFFYGQVFGFTPADTIEPVLVGNTETR